MPLLPLKALRRNSHDDDGEGGRRRVTRGVTLAPAEVSPQPAAPAVEDKVNGAPVVRPRSLTADPTTPGSKNVVGIAPAVGSPGARRHSIASPQVVVAPTTVTKVIMTPVRHRVSFAPSPNNQATDITPYAQVYGVHPAFFDFDQNGVMQPTQQGVREMQCGTLVMTPSAKGRAALVVQGTGMSPGSDMASPICSRNGGAFWAPSTPSARSPFDMPFSLGEQVLVVTDDGKAWMDGQVIAVFPVDAEAEGYSIPGGTVKISYELGIKWVMPQNISTTLRKKAAFGTAVQQQQQQQQQQPPPRQIFGGYVQQQQPAAVGGGASWQVYPGGHMSAFAGRPA